VTLEKQELIQKMEELKKEKEMLAEEFALKEKKLIQERDELNLVVQTAKNEIEVINIENNKIKQDLNNHESLIENSIKE